MWPAKLAVFIGILKMVLIKKLLPICPDSFLLMVLRKIITWLIRMFVVPLVVFTAVFALFGAGIPALMQKGLLCTADNASFNNVLRAFFTSFFMNMIFAYPMMLAHEYFNEVINRKKFIGGGEFLSSINAHIWGSFIPKTILYFWVPAHTITFLLPENYRVLASARLALVLGFLLTFHAPKTPAKAE